MNAIDLLEKEHQGAKKALAEVSAASGSHKKELFDALKKELEMHDHIEEQVFYPAVLAHPKSAGLSAGDKEAHQAVEKALAELATMPIGSAEWPHSFMAMQTKLLAHIADEEGNLFPKIRKALSAPELETLGLKMKAEKERQLKAA